MGRYVLRRIAMLVPTLIGMSILIFLMLRLLPGDIVDIIAGSDAQTDSASRAKLREAMGLADPLWEQYARWLWQHPPGRSRHLDALGPAGQRIAGEGAADHD